MEVHCPVLLRTLFVVERVHSWADKPCLGESLKCPAVQIIATEIAHEFRFYGTPQCLAEPGKTKSPDTGLLC
jgi:hypothetical protein